MANIHNPVLPSPAQGLAVPASSSTSAVSNRLSLLSLIFAALSVIFFLLLVFLRIPFPLNPLMSWQDALDVLTPLALIPLYWLMFQTITRLEKDRGEEMLFVVFAAVWAMGQGMHLAANSINNLIGNLAKKQVLDVSGTDIYTLTYFYDETLSHYVWHIGVLGLAALLMYASWRRPAGEKTHWWLVVPAGLLYGVNCFFIFVEGLTTPLSFPVVTAAALISILWGRKQLAQKPILAFFTISFLLAFVLIACWSLYNTAFPPPEILK